MHIVKIYFMDLLFLGSLINYVELGRQNFDQKFVAMQRIYSEKTNERISQQKLKATNTGGLCDELRQRLVAVWKDLE